MSKPRKWNPSEGAAPSEVTVSKWSAGREIQQRADQLAPEEPLEIRIDDHPISVTMRTPGADAELAAGFLVSEGLIQSKDQILKIAPHPRNPANIINVFLRPEVVIDFQKLTRHVFASSSCGLCGKASIDSLQQQFPMPDSSFTVHPEILLKLPALLRDSQTMFAQTGGLHGAALFDAKGNLLVLREDVGRHNAVDKAIGWALFNRSLPLKEVLLMVSGRTSFEILQKALSAGIPMIAAVSAPSSLAVEFAKNSGQTLVGFLRGETFNIYAHPERIEGLV